MSTSNTSSMDQARDPRVSAELREKRKQRISNSLAKRHRKEKMFRIFGFSAVITGLFFVVLLFGSILAKGLPAFWQTSMTVPVYFDPTVITAARSRLKKQANLLPIFKSALSLGKLKWGWLIGML